MKIQKTIPIVIIFALLSVTLFSGCIGRTIDTMGWDHINLEGTAVRIWGQLALTESSDNWNEGFVWDTEAHNNWRDYRYRAWADNHYGLGFFSLNIQNLSRTTTYHYRAYGEYIKGQSQFRFGVDVTFIPGGPRVTSENASDIRPTQVTVNGYLRDLGGASSCEVFFLYGTDQNVLDQVTPHQNMTAVGPFSATLTDLTTNTTYYYKAVAKNDADEWSGFILSTTPGRPVVFTREPGDVGKDYAILKGELRHTGGTATCSVWFIYGDVSPNQLDQSTTPQIMNTTGPFQANISNLKLDTKYWYRAIADNGLAQAKGDISDFTTGQTPTSGVPAKPSQPFDYTQEIALLRHLPSRYVRLLENHPILLILLLHRYHALMNTQS